MLMLINIFCNRKYLQLPIPFIILLATCPYWRHPLRATQGLIICTARMMLMLIDAENVGSSDREYFLLLQTLSHISEGLQTRLTPPPADEHATLDNHAILFRLACSQCCDQLRENSVALWKQCCGQFMEVWCYP